MYDKKEPTSTVIGSGEFNENQTFVTTIRLAI